MLVLAIAVYATLDFSLAAMPGAFVFDPNQTVETIQNRNGRAGIELLTPALVVPSSFVPSAPRADLTEAVVSSPQARAPVPRISAVHRPRGTLEPTASSEDPH
jgi:hypothetical protein